ncbi:MAG: glycosyltransferase family 2 protein [Promethearchaeota archaeon]
MTQLRILIIIPCYNEGNVILENLERLSRVQDSLRTKYRQPIDLLIIDDGSEDNCQQILEQWHSIHPNRGYVIHEKQNKGYGATLRTGFSYSQEKGYDWVITFDMDGQHASDYLSKFIEAIWAENDKNYSTDLFSGTRYAISDLFWHSPWKDRFLVNSIITAVLSHFGLELTDSFCGMKAHRVDSIKDLHLTLTGYEMPIEMLLKGQQLGWKIKEIPIPLIYKNRETILTEERSHRFIFDRAEHRLKRYCQLIKTMNPRASFLKIKPLLDIYKNSFLEYEKITKENFKEIQSKIDRQIRTLFNSSHIQITTQEIERCCCFSTSWCSPTCEIYLMCKLNSQK